MGGAKEMTPGIQCWPQRQLVPRQWYPLLNDCRSPGMERGDGNSDGDSDGNGNGNGDGDGDGNGNGDGNGDSEGKGASILCG